MPGIAGIIAKDPHQDSVAPLNAMLKCMLHERFYTSGTHMERGLGIGVGWACLGGSFSDCLPVWNEAKDIGLVFSGENFAEPSDLAGLRARGHAFDPDNASALVHLYEEQGLGFLEKLNGWFSGVLLDLREKRVVLFNDRYGLNRIYYHENETGFYFSSEAKSLLKVLPESRRFDPVGLAEALSCGCALQNRTLFSGISLLPGGSQWIFSTSQPARKGTYFGRDAWENQPRLGHEEYYQKLKEVFARILPKYLGDEKQVAMSLTGGLDGRMIMAWAGCPPRRLPCYTFGSSYRDCTDVRIAREVALACRQPHQVIPVDGKFLADFPEFARRAVWISDGALDVSGSVELYVNQVAREIAPIRLTGNYGSEILRGNVAFRPASLDPAVYAPELVDLGRKAAETYTREAQGHPLSFIAFKQVPWHHCSRLAVEQSQLTARSPYLDNDLVALAFQTPLDLASSKQPALRLIAEGNPELGRIPTDRGLLYRPIPVVTRARHWYEELSFRAEYAYDYGMPQWLARVDHLMAPFYPERAFLGRHKFYHFRIWYRDRLADYLKEVLLEPRLNSSPYLKAGRLEALVKSHVLGRQNHTAELHRILTLELIQQYLIGAK